MKKLLRPMAAICLAALTLTACKKNAKEAEAGISEATLAKIESMGFSTAEAMKVDGGYLVEGDILLTEENLSNSSNSPHVIIGQEEQYRTINLVRGYSTIKVGISLDAASSGHLNLFTTSLNKTLARYNALYNTKISIQFVNTNSSPDITMVGYNERSNVLGSSGFPTSDGKPFNSVRMNTYHYDKTNLSTAYTDYVATIMAHELGHCIGFRHTDYMDRSFSCGGRKQNEEKPFSSGLGAILISGTPSTPDAGSWMLACIGTGQNRNFNANDVVALDALY
jgi:predicted Zn-dependent protease